MDTTKSFNAVVDGAGNVSSSCPPTGSKPGASELRGADLLEAIPGMNPEELASVWADLAFDVDLGSPPDVIDRAATTRLDAFSRDDLLRLDVALPAEGRRRRSGA